MKKTLLPLLAIAFIISLSACQTANPTSAKHFQAKGPIHNLSQKKRCGC